MKETLKAADLLINDWGVDPGVWNVTSFSELRRDAEETERWNLTHPQKNKKNPTLIKILAKTTFQQ